MASKRTAGGKPAWLRDMYDIIDGLYDNDTDEIRRLLAIATEEIGKKGFVYKFDTPAMATRALRIVRQAAEHQTELLTAKVNRLKARYEELQESAKHKGEVRDELQKALDEACKKGAELQKQLTEEVGKIIEDKPGKTLYQRLVEGEFNGLDYKTFFDILIRSCEEEAARIDAESNLRGRSAR